ncbi:MAG: tetratricopeptide repeat protein [Candidatus Heimdallarchaeota archaeon]|nr:tetratricopeptide repeat protein [Candidatus Heimdallarchaeota archaeon]
MKEIDELIKSGKLDEALSEVKSRLEHNPLPVLQIKQVEIFIHKNQMEEAEIQVNELLQHDIPTEYLVDSLYYKAFIFMRKREYDKAIEILDEALNKITPEIPEMHERKLTIYQRKAPILFELGRYNEMLEITDSGIQVANLINTEDAKIATANFYYNKGMCLHVMGEIEPALDAMEKSRNINEELGRQLSIGYNYMEVGGIKQAVGRLEEALEDFKRSHDLFHEYGTEIQQSWSYTDLGNVYLLIGDVNHALEYYEKALPIYENGNDNRTLANHLISMSNAYRAQGELEKAMQFAKRAKVLYEKVDNKPYLGKSYESMAETYMLLGEIDKGSSHINQANELFRSSNTITWLIPALYQEFKIKLNQRIDVKDMISELEVHASEQPLFRHYFHLAKILTLKESDRLQHKAEAQILANQILEEPMTDFRIRHEATFAMLDLLFEEFINSNNKVIQAEIEQKLGMLLDEAKKEYAVEIQLKVIILQSKLKLLNDEVKLARFMLNQASKQAIERGYQIIAQQITSELMQIEDKRRISLDQVKSFFKTLLFGQKKLDENEVPMLFMIISSSNGTSILSEKFNQDHLDDQLISAFLSAINAFVSEAFNQSGIVDRIKFREYNIVLQPAYNSTLAYIVQGESYKSTQRMLVMADRISNSSKIKGEIDQAVKTGIELDSKLLLSYISEIFEME